ncbi:MAG TPA: hypothetical protein VGC09_12365 [Rhodopila sp.]
MPTTGKKTDMPTDETTAAANDMIELDPSSDAVVAGGLNPQPLPPRFEMQVRLVQAFDRFTL